jgi:transposase InsO family protein
VKFAFIDAEKAHYAVAVLCSVLSVSRSGFYAWRGRPKSARAKADAQLAVELAAVHRRTRGRYGSPRIHAELRARGHRIGRKRIERVMRERGLRARHKRRFRRTTESNHSFAIAPNVLQRDFQPASPNAAWVTDVTYIATDEGWLYLAAILDLFSRRVVGWAVSATNDTALALTALQDALEARRPPAGLIHHSDRGSPYASDEYRMALKHHGVVASMSRRGDCWDNAPAESFFATLRVELTDHERYASRAAATVSIGDYLDGFYNTVRRHSHLGYVSPIEFELKERIREIAA